MSILTEDIGIPAGGSQQNKQLPWTTLPKILSKQGCELENWPSDVPLPGSGSLLCDDNKGINGLNTKHLTMLHKATRSGQLRLSFKRVVSRQGDTAGLPVHASSSGSLEESSLPNDADRRGKRKRDGWESDKRLRLTEGGD